MKFKATKEQIEYWTAVRKIREQIHRRYIDLLNAGNEPEVAIPELLKIFYDRYVKTTGRELTLRVINNIVGRPVGAVADSLTEAKILLTVQDLIDDLAIARQKYDLDMDHLDELEENGEEWVETDRVERHGGRNAGEEYKSISISEARHRLIQRRLDLHDRLSETLKKYIPSKMEILTRSTDLTPDEREHLIRDVMNDYKAELAKATGRRSETEVK